MILVFFWFFFFSLYVYFANSRFQLDFLDGCCQFCWMHHVGWHSQWRGQGSSGGTWLGYIYCGMVTFTVIYYYVTFTLKGKIEHEVCHGKDSQELCSFCDQTL